MEEKKKLQKYNFQKYRNTNYRNIEIKITNIPKYRNINDRNTETNECRYTNTNLSCFCDFSAHHLLLPIIVNESC